VNINILKPCQTARDVPRTAAVTEAKPLIPHAHGTRDGFVLPVSVRAAGKGMPIKKAKGAQTASAENTLPTIPNPMRVSNA